MQHTLNGHNLTLFVTIYLSNHSIFVRVCVNTELMSLCLAAGKQSFVLRCPFPISTRHANWEKKGRCLYKKHVFCLLSGPKNIFHFPCAALLLYMFMKFQRSIDKYYGFNQGLYLVLTNLNPLVL